ncbi:MAG: rod shape-determining protein MreC [Ruminococcaceae bacterium]|nr:rod shape-determining protein MreC [Oscillospiraceae bacterium]
MRDFLKTKTFFVLLILMIIFTVVPSVMTMVGAGGHVRNAVNVIVSPVQKLFNYATDAISGFTSYFTEFDRIVEENNALREELTSLKDQISSSEETEQMNEWLYRYLELRREHTDFGFADANVTGRESGNYMTVFTLDKGTAHGIKSGMPAVTDYGVVGYVSEAGLDWCKVVTLLESNSAAGVYIERTGEAGIVEGDFALASEGLCKMLYIDAESSVHEGDRIFTSGYGSVYPRGLLVGYVEKVEPDANTRTLVAYVRPAEQMKDIRRLMIITEYEVVADE